jgi:hypothetical protein
VYCAPVGRDLGLLDRCRKLLSGRFQKWAPYPDNSRSRAWFQHVWQHVCAGPVRSRTSVTAELKVATDAKIF